MWEVVWLAKSNKDKLQFCLSFKNTEEERALYEYVISQNDKSVFLKDLIRKYKNGDFTNGGVVVYAQQEPTPEPVIDRKSVV